MSHTARLIFSLIFLHTLLFSTGCALFDHAPDPERGLRKAYSRQRVFYANYDVVWKAAHTVLKYPIAVDNQDNGTIETEYIKAVDGWLPPEVKENPSSGIRYKLIFSFAKGKADGRDSTRITIDKKIEVLKNFFAEPESLESDGLEEKILFYRIERELVINEALKKIN